MDVETYEDMQFEILLRYLEKNIPKTFSFFLWLMKMQMTDVPNRWAEGLWYWGDNTSTELFIPRILYKEDLEQ